MATCYVFVSQELVANTQIMCKTSRAMTFPTID